MATLTVRYHSRWSADRQWRYTAADYSHTAHSRALSIRFWSAWLEWFVAHWPAGISGKTIRSRIFQYNIQCTQTSYHYCLVLAMQLCGSSIGLILSVKCLQCVALLLMVKLLLGRALTAHRSAITMRMNNLGSSSREGPKVYHHHQPQHSTTLITSN